MTPEETGDSYKRRRREVTMFDKQRFENFIKWMKKMAGTARQHDGLAPKLQLVLESTR